MSRIELQFGDGRMDAILDLRPNGIGPAIYDGNNWLHERLGGRRTYTSCQVPIFLDTSEVHF